MINISKEKYWDRALSWVDGCTPCSPGCEHCWSAGMAHRFIRCVGPINAERMRGEPILTDDNGRFNGRIITRPERLSIPLKRRKPTVYAVWNDLFHEEVPEIFISQALAVTAGNSPHTFLILTKRPKHMADYFAGEDFTDLLRNVYFGLTVCNQQEADAKIPVFFQVSGKKFLSIEPMLGEIDISDCLWEFNENYQPPRFLDEGESYNVKPTVPSDKIDAVILGGETAPGARPMHPDWVRSVRDQCDAAGVPFFFKGWGEWLPVGEMPTLEFKPIGENDALSRFHLWGDFDKNVSMKIGRKAAGRLLDGRTHNDLPWRELL